MKNLLTTTLSTITINYDGNRTKATRTRINKEIAKLGIEMEIVRDELEVQWFVVYKDEYYYFRSGITINL